MNENESPGRPARGDAGAPAGLAVDVADADPADLPGAGESAAGGTGSSEASSSRGAAAAGGSADALRAAIEASAAPPADATDQDAADAEPREPGDGAAGAVAPEPLSSAAPAGEEAASGTADAGGDAAGGDAAGGDATESGALVDTETGAVAEPVSETGADATGPAGHEPSGDASDGDADEAWPTLDDVPPPPPHRRFDCTGDDVEEAAEAARAAVEAGECIVLPTDTVYGIGADAFSAAAVQRLLDAKGRGRDMPPPVLISDAAMVKALADKVPGAVQPVIDRFWPGALTIVVHAKESLKLDLGESAGTIGLRVPDHAVARDLLRRTGPLAVSSANRTGHPAATTVDEAIDMLGDTVSVYLDGGPAAGGAPPSTMVDFTTHEGGRVLRVGAVAVEALRELLPDLIAPRVKPVVTSAADISAAILALSAAPEPAPEPEPPSVAESPAEPDPAGEPDEAGAADPTAPPSAGTRPAEQEPGATGPTG